MQVDVARGGFIDLDVAASRATFHRARNLACPYIARSRLQTNLAGQFRELHVARPGLRVHIAACAFNDLISRAAARANGRIRGHTDLVIYRNVAHVHVVNVNAVALLPDRRMLLDLVDVGVPVATQPVVANVDLSPDEY